MCLLRWRLRAELDAKDQQLKQMNLKVEEYKENLIQVKLLRCS